MNKLGFIGTGKITSAIVEELCNSDIGNARIFLSKRNEIISEQLARKYNNVYRLESNQSVIENSSIIFIALPPEVAVDEILKLKFNLSQNIVSLIRTTNLSLLLKILKPIKNISRAIPLSTVVNHNCPIPIFNADQKIEELFRYLGQPIKIENEKVLHTIWALTGLIAPYYDFINGLTEWAVSKGVEKSKAVSYISNMYHLISHQSSKLSIDELTENATSPGGLNEQSLNEIKGSGIIIVYKTMLDNLLKSFPNI